MLFYIVSVAFVVTERLTFRVPMRTDSAMAACILPAAEDKVQYIPLCVKETYLGSQNDRSIMMVQNLVLHVSTFFSSRSSVSCTERHE